MRWVFRRFVLRTSLQLETARVPSDTAYVLASTLLFLYPRGKGRKNRYQQYTHYDAQNIIPVLA